MVFPLPPVRRPDQVRLSEAAPGHLKPGADTVNRALDVTFALEHNVVVAVYDLP